MAYKSYYEQSNAIKELRLGKVQSIPCIECEKGTISSNPDIPIEKQVVFYCNNCKAKIIIN